MIRILQVNSSLSASGKSCALPDAFVSRGRALYPDAMTVVGNQTPYVRRFLAFLGTEDVDVIYAEGLAMGDDAEHTIARARNDLERLPPTI
ncbi:MAG TPA: hypothetical protein VKO85_11965 [Wenzhouxiangellaceae bacterium]|nr:hypothetical protein [Wenzhouxiangellaceae bacterium]